MIIYTVNEVAEFMKVSTATVVRAINKGQLSAIRIASCWRITDDQFNEWLTSRTVKRLKKNIITLK